MLKRVRGKPFVFYVAGLALALILPALVFSTVVARQWVNSERDRLETSLRNANEDALARVDRYLAGVIAMLQALATSPALDAQDFGRFDRQARELGALQNVDIALRDLSGQLVMNTRFAPGTKLPRTDQDVDRLMLERPRPEVSDVFLGAASKRPLVMVNVPVLRDGKLVYSVRALLTPEVVAKVIQDNTGAFPSVSLAATDRKGQPIAGSPVQHGIAVETLLRLVANGEQSGRLSGDSPQGDSIVTSYARSPLSGWIVTASLDKTLMEASLKASVWSLGVLSLLLTALALAAASVATRQMMGAHHDVAAAAKLLGDGKSVAAPRTAISEVNLIAEEIAAASVRLNEQASALEAANLELERRVEERTKELADKSELIAVTLENMDQGLIMIDPSGRIPVCNRRAIELLDLPVETMLRKPSVREISEFEIARNEAPVQSWVRGLGEASALHTYERERPNGTILEIRTVPLADGAAVRTYTDITARKTAERHAQHMARHDPLTDLPNRTLFRERLGQHISEIRRHGGSLAVLSLDLDRFKLVNDTLGHPAGDALLKEVAGRIKSALRVEDTVSRLGGDEFAIIQVGEFQPHASSLLSDRLIAEIGRPVMLDGTQVTVGASVGIAVASEDCLDPDQLFKNADRALYRAKNEGRGTFRYYELAMDAAVDARRRLELDLRQALPERQFALHFQPVLNVASGCFGGFEALLRWIHPSRGSVPPGEFIEIAEEIGLIVPIGEWVLREACRQAAGWPGDLAIAVNISAVQFGSDLVSQVVCALAASGLSPNRLELEITETVLIRDVDTVIVTLHHLRDLGVRIALDDFGIGYSSLSYLRKFPFDKIKIDRSFIAEIGDPDTAAIVRAIVGLGARLGSAVTAEGVETQQQFDMAVAEGCTEIQGYLVSRPVPAEDAARLVQGMGMTRMAGAA